MNPVELPEKSVVDLHVKRAGNDELEVIYTLVDPVTWKGTSEQYSKRATVGEVFRAFPVTLAHKDKVLGGVVSGRLEHLTRTTL